MDGWTIPSNVREIHHFFKTQSDVHPTHSPEVLRCLMGYIIDLTLVMDQLFLNTLPIKPPRLLDLEQVDLALEDYKNTTARQVHYQIREYAKKSTFTQILVSNNAQQKVIELIQQHRVGCEKPLKP